MVARVNSSLQRPRKWSLNWFMPAGREEHRGVPARHQHVAGAADAAFGLEEGQVFFAEFVGFHGFMVVGGDSPVADQGHGNQVDYHIRQVVQ